ncbi:MAG: transglutaminase domain-containing protein [Spirochaetota bacterium]|nr:MAG: transglutaminase domain-containing protein [Spirochaetota bacterium]
MTAFALSVVLGVIIYSLPATWSLASGPRPGVEDITLDEAVTSLGQSGVKGWDLIEEARLLVGECMEYSRRNSFDSYRKAFWRGYGYCQQQAYALTEVLRQLGFDAWPVHSEHNDFPEKKDTGHAWVQVIYEGEIRDLDPRFMDPGTGEMAFHPRTPASKYTVLFRIFSGWGCLAGNAYRYYRTGSDTSSDY